jgi:ElaB/YqjD/DUF883 family membrane-anchored ribosome-binding protein
MIESKADELRHKAADVLEDTADKARETGDKISGPNRAAAKATEWSRDAGHNLDRAATYLRQHSA